MKYTNKRSYLPVVVGAITGMLITLFLRGTFIDIPHGTHRGGIISAVGVMVIIVAVPITAIGVMKLKSKFWPSADNNKG